MNDETKTESRKPKAEMPTPEQFRAVIEQAARYLQANEKRIRSEKAQPEWNAERVTQSLVFHAVRRTLGICRFEDGQIAGLAIAWLDDEAAIRAADVRGDSAFRWQESNPVGDSIYFALLVTSHKDAMKRLVEYFKARFPGSLKLLAHRRGKLVEETGIMERIAAEGCRLKVES